MTCGHSIISMKSDEEKIHKLSNNLAMGICGEAGDTTQFAEFIGKNIQLYRMRNGYQLSPEAAATYTRRNLADYLRSRTPYSVNMILGGFDETGSHLYFIDYLASMIKVPFIGHGYGSIFSLSILDKEHRPDMTKEEALALLMKCIKEIHTRLIINMPNFSVCIIDKDGVHKFNPITPGAIAENKIPAPIALAA